MDLRQGLLIDAVGVGGTGRGGLLVGGGEDVSQRCRPGLGVGAGGVECVEITEQGDLHQASWASTPSLILFGLLLDFAESLLL